MNQQKGSKFHVIELSEPPYTDSDKYVCVPNSWIRLRETQDGIVIVKFPIEKLSETKKRVKKEETFSDNWTIFLAEIKYDTDSYKDANEFIKILDKISTRDRRRSKGVGEDTPSISDNEMLEPLPGSSEMKEVHIASALLSSGTESMTNQRKSEPLELTNPEIEVCQEKTKLVGTADSTPQTKRYLTRQSLRMASPANTFRLLDQTENQSTKETSKSVKGNSKIEHNKENALPVKNPSKSTNESGILAALRLLLGDNFKEILKQLHSEFENSYALLNNLRLAFLKNCTLLKKMIEIVEQVSDCDQGDYNVASTKLKNNVVEEGTNINNIENDKIITGLEIRNDDKNVIDGNEGKEHKKNNPSNKIRGKARKFTLPPEYDSENSKWTLKHHEKKNNLVELIPKSGVYVDALKLGHCQRKSKDSKTLAKMLLVEIFSENALSVCSLTGKKANAFDVEGTNVRPGLDEHARTVLLNYVEQYALDHKWNKLDTHTVLSSVRNKIQEIRAKYG